MYKDSSCTLRQLHNEILRPRKQYRFVTALHDN
jgi:hypothetical protein